jgi:uncharacterized membrane protein
MTSRTLRIAMIVLTVIGLAVATYLTIIHYGHIKPLCGRSGGSCAEVQSSKYSKVAGVPVALVGLIGYVLILASLLAPDREETRLATAALVLGGFGFSAYLTYREIFTLEKICEWCASSAVIMTILVVLAVWRFLLGDPGPADRHAGARGPGEPSADSSTESGAALGSPS